LDRILALFASIYAEHAPRPEDLQARFGGTESSSDESDSGGDAWPVSVSQAAAKAARKRAREVERDQRWEDEVDHLTMSVKLWSLVSTLPDNGLYIVTGARSTGSIKTNLPT
jgi:origin recognition complex subunit 5